MVEPLTPAQVDDVVAVFTDAFHDYPVMRWVLGPASPYDERLERLVRLFVSGRALRAEPMFGLRDHTGALAAAAIVTPPASPDAPPALLALREATWSALGADARARYDAFVATAQRFAIAGPHHHLNMIGVRRAHQGQGHARALLGAVHDLARADPGSSGVSLSTELPANVALYEHFGYRVHGHARVSDQLETWTLFRQTAR